MAEIERKWRLSALPPDNLLTTKVYITQRYLFTDGGELRTRSKGGGQFFVTIKGEGTLTREEWEAEIPEWAYGLLWKKGMGKGIMKNRFSVMVGDYTLEIDIYEGDFRGLIIMECEFPDEASANAFELPDWAVAAGAVDVTADKRYKNKNLALSGIPPAS